MDAGKSLYVTASLLAGIAGRVTGTVGRAQSAGTVGTGFLGASDAARQHQGRHGSGYWRQAPAAGGGRRTSTLGHAGPAKWLLSGGTGSVRWAPAGFGGEREPTARPDSR